MPLWLAVITLGSAIFSCCPTARAQQHPTAPLVRLPAPLELNPSHALPAEPWPFPGYAPGLLQDFELPESVDPPQELKLLSEGMPERLRQVNSDPKGSSAISSGAVIPTSAQIEITRPPDEQSPAPDYLDGVFTPYSPVPDYWDLDITSPNRMPLTSSFGPGFQFQTVDQAFRLQIHYESQVEARVWEQPNDLPPDSGNSGFYLPRQRIFFNGNVGDPLEYEFAINRGLNNINLLNAFVNLHYDDRIQLRFGRFFTPLPYDQYAISNYWLLTPERSLFTTNVGLNRQIGMMAWGYLFDDALDYAAGLFNGSRNSFENFNSAVDAVGYVNARPFQNDESAGFVRFLNVGTSVAVGHQDELPVPVAFRIGAGSPDANIPGPATVPFLILNSDVVERGERLLGSVNAACFHRSLSLIGEWQYGFGSYASPAVVASDRVPFSGYYVAAGYFLTGEEVERRTRVYPLRPFVPLQKATPRGPGAWELVSRVSELKLGSQVFNSGFADPSVWSRGVVTTEVGLNWYWNEYVKLYGFWLHGEFDEPIQVRPGKFRKSADMFWLRFQLYF
jgi:phosphate-selective porin OprO/OprP